MFSFHSQHWGPIWLEPLQALGMLLQSLRVHVCVNELCLDTAVSGP